MKYRVNVLKNLILKLENELFFFEENTKLLQQRKFEISKKYNVGLKIGEFLDSIKDSKGTLDDIKSEYEKFSQQKISNSNLTFGDVFVINDQETSSEKIAYGLRICKDNERYIPEIACEKIFQVNVASSTIAEKTIVNCLQIFEEYFSSILRVLISMKPEAYFYNKTIKYSEMINKKIEDLKNEFINEEVAALMHGVSETIGKVNQTHKLNLEKYQDIWDAYIELDLRRNLIVHNEGRVNKKYLAGLPKTYPKPKDGTSLTCDDIYVTNSIETIIKFSYLLYYLIAEGDDELEFLTTTAFEFLSSKKWNLAYFAYNLLLIIPTLKNEERIVCKINSLIAKKYVDGLETTKEEIQQLDVSGMENKYAIAKNLLLEKHAEVNELLKIDYPKSFSFHMIQTWPIFIEYRKSEEYRIFINEHQSEYAEYELKE